MSLDHGLNRARNNLPYNFYSLLLAVPGRDIRRLARNLGYETTLRERKFWIEKRPLLVRDETLQNTLDDVANEASGAPNGLYYRLDLWSKSIYQSWHVDIHQREIIPYSGIVPEPNPGQISVFHLYKIWAAKFDEAHPSVEKK